ncbi:MAG: biotin transport system substrate-specific component [Blastocatellia bacterium]|nr:biotin transport system substrate-specific component [Blastocatellia bacterium]MDX6305028.1 biotin transport system substrate-specific component [Blastocatellia bacterium]
MSTAFAKDETLLGVALAPLDVVRQVGLVIGFSLLTALAAQVVIPIGPIPLTGQTFVVLLTGALLGSRLGAMAMIAYLVEGASGLPFFQSGHFGLLYMMGPTGGYLIAFPAAAYVTGAFAEHGWDRRFLTAAAAMAIGSAIIMLSGWAWFSVIMRTSPMLTLYATVIKFIPGDIIKITLAAAVLPSGWKLLKR